MIKYCAKCALAILILVTLGCATNTIKIETENDHYLYIPTPNSLKLNEGIWANYNDGTILITSEFIEAEVSASNYLDQLYGDKNSSNEKVIRQKAIVQKDSISITNLELEGISAYLIKHRYNYDLLVFAYNSSNQIIFVTGKGIDLAGVIKSLGGS